METKLETNEVKTMIDNTKADVLAAIQSLQRALAPDYIVTGCDVNIGTVDLVGGGKLVYSEDVDITVEVARGSSSQHEPLPKLPPIRIPIQPIANISGGKFDAKHEVEMLKQTVRQLIDYVNELRRDVDKLQGYRKE